jgi:hypothetical protein
MATNNFLIDAAQSAGTIAKNIFDKAGNFGSIGGTFVDSLVQNPYGDANLMSSEMEEEIMNQVYSDIRKYGKTDGGIGYSELGLPSIWTRTGEHPRGLGEGGLFSAKNAIALTGGKMDYSVNPQTGMFGITGGADYNFPKGVFGNNKVSNVVSNHINSGGTQWNPQGIQLDPARIQKELHNYSMGSADRHYDRNQVVPKAIDVDYDSNEYWKDYWKETPYDTLSEPPVKIRPETFPTQPTSTPVGTSATALAQIQANISAAATKEKLLNKKQSIAPIDRTKKTTAASGMMSSGPPRRSYAEQAKAVNTKAKSMGVKSPIRRSGNRYGFGL